MLFLLIRIPGKILDIDVYIICDFIDDTADIQSWLIFGYVQIFQSGMNTLQSWRHCPD